MAYLAAAVVVVGLIGVVDLILTFGVIRRLRKHTELLSRVSSAAPNPLGVGVGETPADFTVTTVEGETVSRRDAAGLTLIGFFAPGCDPCAAELPNFVDYARSLPGGPRQALAVVESGGDDTDAYTEQLGPVARVVLEETGGAAKTAFKVFAFPSLYLLAADGTVAAAGTMVRDLGELPVRDVAAV